MEHKMTLFGVLPDGQRVYSHKLFNMHGMEITVINFGAIITSLKVPAKNGMTDVVLGFDTLEDYLKSHSLPAPPYFGAIIGRYSGRIKNGQFQIDNTPFQLIKNNGNNTLHGGKNGFDRVLWKIKEFTNTSVTFSYTSVSNEENFPGKLIVDVTYSITDENEVVINYDAISTEDTIVNLTQHSYFNLDGHQADITAQRLIINSEMILEIDDQNIPSGNIIKASEKNSDFSKGGKSPFFGIDDTFIISSTRETAAVLISNANKLRMTVTSDQPALHIYVGGSCFGLVKGKQNADYYTHSGICFESQNYPDAPNQAHFPNSILRKDDHYKQITTWKFETL